MLQSTPKSKDEIVNKSKIVPGAIWQVNLQSGRTGLAVLGHVEPGHARRRIGLLYGFAHNANCVSLTANDACYIGFALLPHTAKHWRHRGILVDAKWPMPRVAAFDPLSESWIECDVDSRSLRMRLGESISARSAKTTISNTVGNAAYFRELLDIAIVDRWNGFEPLDRRRFGL